MAYKNQFTFAGRGHGNYGYNKGGTPYRNSGYNGNYKYQGSGRPHSGCKVQKDVVAKSGKKKALIVNGWKYTKKFGMVSFVAVPAKAKFQKGGNHTTMVVSMKSSTGVSTLWGYWNVQKQILSIPDVRMVASGQGNYVSYLMPKSFKR